MPRINVTNGKKVLSFNTDSDNGITLETLKSGFHDAINLVNPSNEGPKLLLSVSNGKVFNHDGWDPDTIYLVHNDNGSRPPKPMDHVATKVLNECSDRVYRVHGEASAVVTITNNHQKESVSQLTGTGVQFQENRILTAAHLKFVLHKEYDIWNNGKTLKVVCKYINKQLDFAILESDSLPKTGFSTGLLIRGDKFVILGYPESSKHDNSSVSDGTIEDVHEDGIHLLGSIGSRHDFSGAPVFDKLSHLTGIVIGEKNGVNLEMTEQHFVNEFAKDHGTQPNVKILPMNVIRAAAWNESCKDSL